ncbi:DUF120 domain-containing protein [Candidatus Micrarchaeota archaeon]|nr:DUF120 domain-containing protein [Candidatus Micrarchaeota archaeon]
MDELILLLAEKGALDEPVRLTTWNIGKSLSMSQQNASIRLRKLAQDGFIVSGERGIKVTDKGRKELAILYSRLSSIFQKNKFIFTGRIVRGSDEGKYYVSIPTYKNRMKQALGFTPFPGTLNIELEETQIEHRIALREHRPIMIKGFRQGGRSFGPVELYSCRVEGYEGALIFPFRSHHGLRVLEIISPYDLSKKLDVSKGSKIKVEVSFK